MLAGGITTRHSGRVGVARSGTQRPGLARAPPTSAIKRGQPQPRRVVGCRLQTACGAVGGGISGSGSGGTAEDDGDEPPPLTAAQQQEQAGAFAYARIAENLERLDANQLQTALATAIAAEDYALAAAIRDRFAQMMDDGGGAAGSAAGGGSGSGSSTDGGGGGARLLDWEALGVRDWVADRAARLGLRFPTEVQRRACPVVLSGSDAVVQSQTGSGKTASFLLPALSRLLYAPDCYPEDMRGPQLLVLVPTFELGTQVALLVYKLFGGNISARRPGDPANLFTYTGPRGAKVRGLLTDGDVSAAVGEVRWLAGAHVLVGTPPEVLHALTCDQPYLDLRDLRVVVADEVDELMRVHPSSFRAILDLVVRNGLTGGDGLKPGEAVPWPAWHEEYKKQQRQRQQDSAGGSSSSSSGSGGTQEAAEAAAAASAAAAAPAGADAAAVAAKPQVVLVGATVTDAEVEEAVARHWVASPVVVRVGTPGTVPKGLRHRALVVADEGRRLAALVSMLRRDLATAGDDEEPARVIVFASSDAAARAAADPLRTALWSEHQLSVLLPSGAEPIKALQAFRDRAASLLLATPSAGRGLDLPAVSHVYNLGPPGDSKEYLHRAGRAGRIGSTTGGLVTSIVSSPAELERLQAIAGELGIELAVEGESEQRGLGLLPGSGGLDGGVDGEEGDDAAGGAAKRGGGSGGGGGGDDSGGGGSGDDLDALRRGLDDIYKLM